MAECPSCGNTLTGKICACGYAVRPALTQRAFTSSPSKATNDAMNARLHEINAYVASYQAEYPGASKRQACESYLRKHELQFKIPPVFHAKPERSFEDAMDEYRAEVG